VASVAVGTVQLTFPLNGRLVMSYTYPIDPKTMFEDRFDQFVAFGIPRADVVALKAAIADT
jgi:hypothetical protein